MRNMPRDIQDRCSMRRQQREWDKPRSKRVSKKLWTERDQDQNDDTKPHCCGVCDASPGGNQMGGLV